MAEMYTSLLEWRRNETTSRLLAKLPPDYYLSTSKYLEDLKRSYESELRENPSARKGEIARQTYQRAGQVARDILESRLQKVLTLAFQASIGAARDLPNSLPEEKAVFDGMLGVLLDYRHRCAPYLEPQAPGAPPKAAPLPPPAPAAAPAPAASPKPAVPRVEAPAAAAPSQFVRIVGERRTIEAGRETIDLAPDDVLTVPAELAKRLVEAKVAEPLRTVPLLK
jgi:DNA replication initiation complex subunit (GINS family)